MKVIASQFTVAEYCAQMKDKTILINKDYQRSSKVWPPAARSYLIDTILQGYPMPKLCLYQKTDVRSRKTIKEIVDGQQRSQAIFDFYGDVLRLTAKSAFPGRKFTQLEEPQQQQFLSYQLSADIFVGASEDEIREVFRRINSYTVPLNPQEKRHAIYQGEFKWFVVGLCGKYAQVLKEIGVFSESQLSRMVDAALFSEFVYTLLEGIQSASETKLEHLYERLDAEFPGQKDIGNRLERAFSRVLGWSQIHNTDLMKSYNFYTLLLATTHVEKPIPSLTEAYRVSSGGHARQDMLLANLGRLAAALEQPTRNDVLDEFVQACSKATNRIAQRKTRFKWFCKALQSERSL